MDSGKSEAEIAVGLSKYDKTFSELESLSKKERKIIKNLTSTENFDDVSNTVDNMIKNSEVDNVAKEAGEVNQAHNLTAKDVPSVRNGEFNKWFDELDCDVLAKIWANPKLKKVKDAIKDRIRHPGAYHEWLACEKAPKFKEWGISMNEIKELRFLTDDVYFLKPDGPHHCSTGGKIAHQELFGLIYNASNYNEFKKNLAKWADTKLKGGRNLLPKGLLDFN